MARWHWNTSGAGVWQLYERTPLVDAIVDAGLRHPVFRGVPPTTTLSEVVDELGLHPLSEREEQQVRSALSAVIEAGVKVFELSAANDGLQIAEVQRILRRIAKSLRTGSKKADKLQTIEKTLHGAKTGSHHTQDIAIALLITKTLAREVGEDKADDMVLNFREWRHPVAAACLKAAEDLDQIKGKGGRPSLDWYPDFQRVLTCIAEKNSIRPTVEINRVTSDPQGRFIYRTCGTLRVASPAYVALAEPHGLAEPGGSRETASTEKVGFVHGSAPPASPR
jgi:hypothetical protein